jgi:multidrug resistance efflux pump
MNTQSPIPIPPALRWREFRFCALPILLFAVAVGVAGHLWRSNITSPALVGAVEVRNAQVIVPYAGKLSRLNVDNFQVVTQGAPLAVLVPSDPRAALAVIQSELNILQIKLGLPQSQQHNETDYEQLRVNWMQQRVDLATARVNYELAHSELARTQQLHELKLVSDDIYDVALKTEQALAVEVLERSNLVVTAETVIKNLKNLGSPQPETDPLQPLMATLNVEEEKLGQAVAATEPVTLVAPIDGTVSIIRQAGENLTEGEPVLTVTATEPEHIISYLRQPIPFEPRVGMQMEVRTRAFHIESGMARIENVGAQFQGITNALAMIRPGVPVDLGLPIEISLPPGLKMRPGELVDLTVAMEN